MSIAGPQRVIPGCDGCGCWARTVGNHGGLQMENQAYTVAEVAALTGFSRRTVTRMFERERGVLILSRPESMHKRSYRSIRIPRAVYERVINRLTVK